MATDDPPSRGARGPRGTDVSAPAGVEPTVRRALHELGTDPGSPPAGRTIDEEPLLEPTVRRKVSDVVPGPRVSEDVMASGPTSVRALSSDSDPLVGATLGEFRVLAPLGSGGMGLVYRGEQTLLGRPVAIKVLRREYAQDPAYAHRLLQEARTVAAVRHPGIIDVLSFGETPSGQPYLVMELLEGEPLDALLARQGPLAPADALALLVPIAGALAAAHDVGVLHRDLKPGNVFVVRLRDGTTFPKLLDFGFARRGEGARVRQTSVAGTPLYIAPEQVRGDEIGPPADLYSFGCLAFELLAGRPPFTAKNISELIDQHLALSPPSLRQLAPSVPPELERLVLRLLAKDPVARPSSAREVRVALEQLEGLVAASNDPTRKVQTIARPPVDTQPSVPAHLIRTGLDTQPSVPAHQPAAALPKTDPDQRAHPRRRSGLVVLAAIALLAGLSAVLLRPWQRDDVRADPPTAPTPAIPNLEPEPTPPAPEPPPRPVVEPTAVKPLPSPPVEPVAVKPPERRPARPATAHTRREVKKRWAALWGRTRELGDDLRRTARAELEDLDVKECRRAPDDCWTVLSEIEARYFEKGGGAP